VHFFRLWRAGASTDQGGGKGRLIGMASQGPRNERAQVEKLSLGLAKALVVEDHKQQSRRRHSTQPTALPCPLRAVFSDDHRRVVETVGEVVRLSSLLSQRGQSFPRVQGTPQPDDEKTLKFCGSFLTIARSFLDNDRRYSRARGATSSPRVKLRRLGFRC
jgi:hypothetical protein